MTNVCAMTLLNSKTQILVIVFVHVVCAEMDSEETKGHAKKSFVSLLKNIVDVNEKRVLAMKKLENLQDFLATNNYLSKIHGYDLEEEDTAEDLRDQHSVLTLIDIRNNLNLTLRRTFKRQEATNNNINIIIPSNSYNIKSEFRNDENNRIGNRNVFDSNMNHNKNDNNKINTINTNQNYKINNSNYKIKESNIENNKSYKIEGTETENYENNYGYGEDVKIHNIKDDSDENHNSNVNDDQKYTTNEDNNAKENRTGDDGDTIYRKNWRGASCDKRAAKVCRKACVDAHKNGCMVYKCSRRAKKAFSKECKRSCKQLFLSGRYSDSEWE